MLEDLDDITRPLVRPAAPVKEAASEECPRTDGLRLRVVARLFISVCVSLALCTLILYAALKFFISPSEQTTSEGAVSAEEWLKIQAYNHQLAKREQAALGKARLTNTLALSERAIASINKFQNELTEWRTWVLPLLTNQEGRRLANRPELFDAIGPYFETEIVDDLNVAKARMGVEEAIAPVRDALAAEHYEFVHSKELVSYLQNCIAVSQAATERLLPKRTRLRQLLSADIGVASSNTLEVALRHHEEREAAKVAAAEAAARAKAREEFLALRAKDASIFERNQQENQRQLELAKQRAAEAALHGQIRNAEAAAAQQRLISYAQSEEVSPFLLPFTTPGYEQLDGTRTSLPRPYSWRKLQASGALVDRSGFDIMLQLVSTSKDKDRPRWFPNGTYDGAHHHRDQIREMQRLLRELGPTLVEVGMLDP